MALSQSVVKKQTGDSGEGERRRDSLMEWSTRRPAAAVWGGALNCSSARGNLHRHGVAGISHTAGPCGVWESNPRLLSGEGGMQNTELRVVFLQNH